MTWNWKTALGMILAGLVPSLPGIWLILVAVGVLPPSGDLCAPRWVLFPFGLVFAMAGAFLLIPGFISLARGGGAVAPPTPLVMKFGIAVVLTCMAVLALYAAWFGDARCFTGPRVVSRVVFTILGLPVGGLAAMYWVLVLGGDAGGDPKQPVLLTDHEFHFVRTVLSRLLLRRGRKGG